MVAEGFPLVDVADVDLDDRRFDARYGVGQGDAGVGEGPGVEDDAVVSKADLVELIDQLALVVALEVLQRHVVLYELALEVDHEILKGVLAVDLRLALAEQVEVGAVDDDDAEHVRGGRGLEARRLGVARSGQD